MKLCAMNGSSPAHPSTLAMDLTPKQNWGGLRQKQGWALIIHITLTGAQVVAVVVAGVWLEVVVVVVMVVANNIQFTDSTEGKNVYQSW